MLARVCLGYGRFFAVFFGRKGFLPVFVFLLVLTFFFVVLLCSGLWAGVLLEKKWVV